MSVAGNIELGVQVSKDRMSAVMQIPLGYPAHMLTPDVCIAQFDANGVVVDRAAEQSIAQIVTQFRNNPSVPVRVTLTGKPPIIGADGRLELAEECRPPELVEPADGQTDEKAPTAIDHYARSPYILVKRGQVIGQVVPPGDGEDGTDVTGSAIPARPGKSFQLKPHETIMVDAHGRIIAQTDGTLDHADNTLRINSVLRIEGRVDFETGNIDFDGDVEIAKGVCDNFKVVATRNAVISGVVEAAELRTGGDLKLITGMFAKDKGSLHAGRACHAKFLQQAKVETVGDLTVDKEIVNCQLIISGTVRSPHASLIGGACYAVGPIEIKFLGSESGIRTLVYLGSSPHYDRLLHAALEKLEALATKTAALQKKIDMLNSGGTRLATQHKEEMTELWCDQMAAQEEHDKLKVLLDGLTTRFDAARTASVTVHHTIHPEARVILGHTAAEFVKAVRGPITITTDLRGDLAFRRTSSDPLQPMRSIARLVHWP